MAIDVIRSKCPDVPNVLTNEEKWIILRWANYAKLNGYGQFNGSFHDGVLENCSATLKEHRAILHRASGEAK
jgi:hypothetical protein